MAGQTDLVALFDQAGLILIAVNLVAIRAADLAVIHIALNEVVPLHPVLVCRHISILIEVGRPGLQFFELPVVRKLLADFKAYRPVIVFALDGVGERLSLAMALNAGIVRSNVVEPIWVDDVGDGWMLNVGASRTMAFLTPYIPLRDLLGLDVVVH